MASRIIPFSVYTTDGLRYTSATAPTVTVQYGSSTPTSLTPTKQSNGWYVTVDDTQDALVLIGGSGIQDDGFTLLKYPPQLDVAVSTRLATSGYTAPPTVTQIWGHTTRSLTTFGTLIADLWSYATRSLTDKAGFAPTDYLKVADYTAPDNASIGTIKTDVTTIKSNYAKTTDIPIDYAKPSDVQVTVPTPVFDGVVAFSGTVTAPDVTVNAPAVTVNPTVLDTTQFDALAKKTDIPTDYLKTSEYVAPNNAKIVDIDTKTSQMVFVGGKVNANAEAVVDADAIAQSIINAMPPVKDGMHISAATVGTDNEPIGRVMPFGVVTVYLSDDLTAPKYKFTADADGDFDYALPFGSVWTLIARLSGYADASAEVSSIE